MHHARPTVVVSRCLGFDACRYNGETIPNRFLKRLAVHAKLEPVCQSGVSTGWLKSIGVGRSTRTPRDSSILAKSSSCSLALSTVSWGLGPHCPGRGEGLADTLDVGAI